MVKKVTEIEKEYELSNAKDSSESVCENAEQEMYTAREDSSDNVCENTEQEMLCTLPRGRGEEDNLTSISAASGREEMVSAESK